MEDFGNMSLLSFHCCFEHCVLLHPEFSVDREVTQTFAQRTDEPLLMSEQLSSPALALLKSTDCVSHMLDLPAGQVGEKQCHLDEFPRDI